MNGSPSRHGCATTRWSNRAARPESASRRSPLRRRKAACPGTRATRKSGIDKARPRRDGRPRPPLYGRVTALILSISPHQNEDVRSGTPPPSANAPRRDLIGWRGVAVLEVWRTYRVYTMRSDGQSPGPPRVIQCLSDKDAIRQTRLELGQDPVEIWEGRRRVVSLEPSDRLSE